MPFFWELKVDKRGLCTWPPLLLRVDGAKHDWTSSDWYDSFRCIQILKFQEGPRLVESSQPEKWPSFECAHRCSKNIEHDKRGNPPLRRRRRGWAAPHDYSQVGFGSWSYGPIEVWHNILGCKVKSVVAWWKADRTLIQNSPRPLPIQMFEERG